MNIENVADLEIHNNVFFWAKKFLVYAGVILHDYSFTNNLLIGALKRPEFDTSGLLADDGGTCICVGSCRVTKVPGSDMHLMQR